jgi:cytochrome c oxidase cbb3-type subunit 3
LLASLSAEDLNLGAQLFQTHCAGCHGSKGEGGRGSSLAGADLPDDNRGLIQVIRWGIPGTEMPPSRIGEPDLVHVAAFVRRLSKSGPPKLRGDAVRGRELFEGKGNCGECHSIGGRGGTTGPDLTEIGSRRNAAYLARALLEPEADIPENFAQYRWVTFLPDNYLQVRAVTKGGKRITGSRLNEDPFTIQIRDGSGAVHSLDKDGLLELHKDWGRSPMPSYKNTFSASELDNLVAYLASLRGKR